MSTYSASCGDLGDLSLAADDKLGLGVVEKLTWLAYEFECAARQEDVRKASPGFCS